MRKTKLLFLLLAFSILLNGQDNIVTISGQVSFISSQNIYIRFSSTAGISAGDTLFLQSGGTLVPALIVNDLSSSSCLCTSIDGRTLAVADLVTAKIRKKRAEAEEVTAVNPARETVEQRPLADSLIPGEAQKSLRQQIRGSLSLVSYSDLSDTEAENSQRFRYTLSLDARNIGNSKFSVESYISFRHKAGEWNEVRNDLFSALKVYTLAARYEINPTTRVVLGRAINQKLSSIGAFDGLQFEKSLRGFTFGVLAGFRPNYVNYGFNSSLFQYGAFVSYKSLAKISGSESSIAFMQQTKDFRTDRRFLYFQHSNSFIRNLWFHATFEADLYRLKIDSLSNEKPQNTFSLTGLYISARYKILKSLTLFGSYDARKNIVYYETYKTFIDRIMETELRQGFRLQVNYRITSDLTYGVQGGYRFLKSDPHPSGNIYSYFTYSRIPTVNISATIYGTYLESNYMNGMVLGLRLNRDFFNGNIQTGIGYSYANYNFSESLVTAVQNVTEFNFSWQFRSKMSLSVNYEGTFEQADIYTRIYILLRKRF